MQIRQFSPKSFMVLCAVALSLLSAQAHAIDTTQVVQEIKSASVAIDAVGLAIIGVVTGMVVIGLIVRMLLRKGT